MYWYAWLLSMSSLKVQCRFSLSIAWLYPHLRDQSLLKLEPLDLKPFLLVRITGGAWRSTTVHGWRSLASLKFSYPSCIENVWHCLPLCSWVDDITLFWKTEKQFLNIFKSVLFSKNKTKLTVLTFSSYMSLGACSTVLYENRPLCVCVCFSSFIILLLLIW